LEIHLVVYFLYIEADMDDTTKGLVRAAGRVVAGMTQSDLADAMGISTPAVSNIELGRASDEAYARVDRVLQKSGVYISVGDASATVTLVQAEAQPEPKREQMEIKMEEENMSEVDLEHYKTAMILSPNGEVFERADFFDVYLNQVNRERAPGSVLPADYVESRDPLTHELLNPSVRHKPKFLQRVGHPRSGKYRRIR
jgi:transcriptional regulator with XRE-family HTH domain